MPAGALKLLDTLAQPAFVEGRYFDILASNHAARALSPGLAAGGNQLRDLFLDPAEQALHPEWEAVTECFVANLRQAVGDADPVRPSGGRRADPQPRAAGDQRRRGPDVGGLPPGRGTRHADKLALLTSAALRA